MKKLNKKGFTLIELLVVIAIIGLLSTLAVVAFGNTRIKARDAKRQSDLKVLQTAIEMYVTDNGAVPGPGSAASTPEAPNAAGGDDLWDGAAITDSLEALLATYMPGGLPEDPSGTPREWIYCYWDTAGGALESFYMIATSLEQNVAISGDLDANSSWLATECIQSSDGTVTSTVPDCDDSNLGAIETAVNSVTAVCLGTP